jgi:hypothetical protein
MFVYAIVVFFFIYFYILFLFIKYNNVRVRLEGRVLKKKKRKYANPKPTWGSLSCSLFYPIRFQPHPEKLSFILDPTEKQGKPANIFLNLCACQYGAGTVVGASGLSPPPLPNPYVPSSVSSRAGLCLVGVRRAVPGCSLNDPQLLPQICSFTGG